MQVAACPRAPFAWMNDVSRQFLGKDYLLNGQSGEDRVAVIADKFGKRLGRTDLAEKFYDYMSRGWYSLSSPVWSNYGLTRGLPISCVVGETWINTQTAGGKQAKDIAVGDMVLTHRGRYRPVTKVMVTEQRSDIWRLKVTGRMTPLYLTGDHLVLTNLGWVRTDELDPNTHLVAVNRVVESAESSHTIDLEPFCDQPHIRGEDGRLRKRGSGNVKATRRVETVSYCATPFARVDVDDDLAWALGLWFAEGSIARGADKKPNGVRITVSAEEKDIADRWLSVMSKKFGVGGYSTATTINRGGRTHSWHSAGVNSRVIGAFFASFGDGCKEKVLPQWAVDLPKLSLRRLLDGMLQGDGSVKKDDTVRLTLANPQLLLQMYQIALKLEMPVSLQMQEKAGKLATTSHVYTMLFLRGSVSRARNRSSSMIPFSDGLGYAPIRDLAKTERVDTVYDFTVEDDHSFSAAGVVLHNCFGSYIEDDMRSILKTHAEIGMMSKYGGGTSAYLNPLRGRGSVITDNGHSAGGVNFALLFDTEIRVVSQGSSRRGECAVYWDIDHPDVPEALTIRHPESEIQKLSYGLCISDEWMKSLIAGDQQKRDLWAKVIKARMKTGYPYLIFIDNARKAAPEEYRLNNLWINHSNLCVTGDQRVVSGHGLRTAKELYELGGDLMLFDNDKAVNASPMRLVERDVDVYKITLANGMTHTVTGYHKVLVRTSKSGYPLTTAMRRCDALSVGDPVAVQTERGLFGPVHMPEEAFLLGLYQGDGTQTDDAVAIDIWDGKTFALEGEIATAFAAVHERHGLGVGTSGRVYEAPKFTECTVAQSTVRKRRLMCRGLKRFGFEKGVVPDWVWRGDEATQWQYVRGLLMTDGTVHVGSSAGNPLQLNLASIDRDMLCRIQLIFANLGISTAIHKLNDGGMRSMPDGRGGHKDYDTRPCWRLVVGGKNDALTIERRTGLLTARGVALEDRVYRDNTKKFHKVVSVEHVGKDDVYCCTVDSPEHLWVCNGVVTSNCSEIFLSNSPDESFVCCLSSMNMLRYDEWKDTDAVEVMVYFLDTVMSEFIEKAKGEYGFERAVRFAERQRALGLGQIGWHSYLMSKMVPYDSMEANSLAAQTSKRIKEQAFAASEKMASELGEPYYLKGRGRRHMTLCVAGDTPILTNEGWVPIESRVDVKTTVWNGYEYSDVVPFSTGKSQLYRIRFSNGFELRCTPEHLFRVVVPNNCMKTFGRKRVLDVPANKLRVGDCMQKFLLPVIDGGPALPEAYTNGAFSGDGSICNSRKGKYPRNELRLYGAKATIADRISWKSKPWSLKPSPGGGVRGYLVDSLQPKFFVPVNNNLHSKLEWLAGIIDTDGSAGSKGVTITTSRRDFAVQIAYLLQTLGVHPHVGDRKRTGGYSSQNDTYFAVTISSHGCGILTRYGLKTSRVVMPTSVKTENDCAINHYVEVIEIEVLDGEHETYCFTEPKNNTGVFAGIMTKQCAIAPTQSSSAILEQVSEGIECMIANFAIKDKQKVKYTYRNPFLLEVLDARGKNTPDVIDSIFSSKGSVQHLDFLSAREKAVFKTLREIAPMAVVQQAAARQPYVCQGQSLNLLIDPEADLRQVNKVYIAAWELGLKSLYYQKNVSAAQEFVQNLTSCASCEG